MGNVIGEILSPAIGIAISPVPIIAVILMLFSKKARSNAPAFLTGWVLALAVVGTVVVLIGDVSNVAESSGPSKGAAVIVLILGVLLLLLALNQWRKRPKEGEEPQMPAWMKGIDSFSTAKSFSMGFILAGLNPKNLPLAIAASITITGSGVGGVQQGAALTIFVVIASITVIVPVFTYLFARERAEGILGGWKDWLTVNNNAVMAVLFLVFSVVLVGRGIQGL